MLSGMEKMLASMLGITPEEMQATVSNAIALLGSLDTRLGEIERKVNFLHDCANPSAAVIDGNILEDKTNVESRTAN